MTRVLIDLVSVDRGSLINPFGHVQLPERNFRLYYKRITRRTHYRQNPKPKCSYTRSFQGYNWFVCIWALASNKARSLSTLIAVNVNKDTEHKVNLKGFLPNKHNRKYPIFFSQQKSNKSQPKAQQWYQHRDQLSLGYDTGVWTADEVKFPWVGQLGSEFSPEMQ